MIVLAILFSPLVLILGYKLLAPRRLKPTSRVHTTSDKR